MKPKSEPLFPLYTVDAFADAPFRGNPAGVCFLMGHQTASWMQQIAAEMNLSETAFFMKKGKHYSLRWFTPCTEVDLCGHATLATAHVIYETEMVGQSEAIHFETRTGLLKARKSGDWIELDLPSIPSVQCPVPEAAKAALGQKPIYACQGSFDYLFELENESQVRNLSPDFSLIKALDARGVIVTAQSSQGKYDYVCRYFGPAVGINEDPVTGSAHCALAPYWSQRLNKQTLLGYQASERGGMVQVQLKGSRALVRGKAVTVMQGVYTG